MLRPRAEPGQRLRLDRVQGLFADIVLVLILTLPLLNETSIYRGEQFEHLKVDDQDFLSQPCLTQYVCLKGEVRRVRAEADLGAGRGRGRVAQSATLRHRILQRGRRHPQRHVARIQR